MRHITDHRSEAVTDDDITDYLKKINGKNASLIYTHPNQGELYIGGVSSCEPQFVAEKNIQKIVNCACMKRIKFI